MTDVEHVASEPVPSSAWRAAKAMAWSIDRIVLSTDQLPVPLDAPTPLLDERRPVHEDDDRGRVTELSRCYGF